MPIYGYKCDSCDHEFERLQRFDAEQPKVCPECGEPTVSKVLSAGYFRMSGGGVYAPNKSDGKSV